MIRASLASMGAAVLLLTVAALPAAAQDRGGIGLAPGLQGGPRGLARPLLFTRPPLLTARDLQAGPTSADRQAQHQAMITRVRGDAGLLGGFAFGTPAAAGRQGMRGGDGGSGGRGHGRPGPIVINNTGPLAVTVGNDNLVQQQSANGPGPIAQQQVATLGGQVRGANGGALNLVGGSGTIVQRAPGGL
jgi:hypothetical protein